MDNIFIERLWRSIKYEEVHLKAYADGREARDGIGRWMDFYNHRRPHQAMNNQRPMAVWRDGMDNARATGRSCGYAASLGQRKRVAHIPTAAAEKTEESGLKIFSKKKRKKRAGAAHTLIRPALGPTDGVHFTRNFSINR